MKLIILLILVIFIVFIVIFFKIFNKSCEKYDYIRSQNIKIPDYRPFQIEIKNFVSDEECNYLINKGSKTLARSTIVGYDDNKYSNARTSWNTFIDKKDPVVSQIYDRIYKITKIPIENYEAMQVARYLPGQEFKPHFDAFELNTEPGRKEYARGKQRVYTFLLYLNDGFEEGGTIFTEQNKVVKPEKGTAVFFSNLNKDETDIDKGSKHGGLPVKSGQKWIANCWIHQEKFV